MAQTEDTELRDLVVEALEKNGSLAKVRALLRANIFLAFEDECENVQHNISLDNILQQHEGILSLSIVYEFLEYCKLKNTMFVYDSETRHGKAYKYEGRKNLCEKLSYMKSNISNEPLLVTIIKTICKQQKFEYSKSGFNITQNIKNGIQEEKNCTYIVHEDVSTDSNQSQSDNSSDEKNKLELRLDNSDTDTSTDSAQDKTSSEYIPNENIIVDSEDDNKKENLIDSSHVHYTESKDISNGLKKSPDYNVKLSEKLNTNLLLNDIVNSTYVSSDSTSYLELQTINNSNIISVTNLKKNNVDSNINVQLHENVKSPCESTLLSNQLNSEVQSQVSHGTSSSVSSSNNHKVMKIIVKNTDENIERIEDATSDYSNDFSGSANSIRKSDKEDSPEKGHLTMSTSNKIDIESPRQHSCSSQSSVSISDVADLIENSDLNSSIVNKGNEEQIINSHNTSDETKSYHLSNKKVNNKSPRQDSDEFSGSPIPSLSNLSLDFHSD